MRRVELFAVGKLRDPHTKALCTEYLERCSTLIQVSQREFRDVEALEAALPERATVVLLDAGGKQLSSTELAAQLERWLQADGSRLIFVIGGADGLGAALYQRATSRLSFGRMTFAHRLVRVMLAEQLYRAVSILNGWPYHR